MAARKITRRDFIAAATLSVDGANLSATAGRKTDSLKDFPVVVIGAGLGGLTCAAYLARQGFPVTVVEQHDIPGGYATAFEREGGKYSFEVSLHGTAVKNGGAARILQELEVYDKLTLVRLPDIYRIKTSSGEMVVPQSDPEGFIRSLCERFPQEAQGIRGFIEEIIAIFDETERSYSVSIYDNLYEGYSQPGRSTLMILALCGCAPWQPFEADYRAGRKEA